MFNQDDLQKRSKYVARTLQATSNFVNQMKFKDGKPLDAVQVYDSIIQQCAQNQVNIASMVPEALTGLIDIFKDSPNAKGQILDSINKGIDLYRSKHGGDMPKADAIAMALDAGHLLYNGLTDAKTDGLYDSANAKNVGPETKSFYDSVSSTSSGHIADVPALAMVTITMMIASASPLVAYLPNPMGTNSLPLLYVRHVAALDYGQTRKNDFLDGIKASAQYFDAIHKFVCTVAGDTATVTSKRLVDEDGKPTGLLRLPMVVGGCRAYLNGVYVGNDEYPLGNKPVVSSFTPKNGVVVKIEGEEYKLESGTHNTNTDTISLKFDKALPAGAEVTVQVIADYERQDGENKDIIPAPNADAQLDYAAVHAYSIRAIYRASMEALTQMQNELGVDMRSAFIAVVIAKVMLEQNTRLLKEIFARAKGKGFERQCDLTRGSDMTQAFNGTSMIGAEIFPAIEDCKRRITTQTGHKPDGFDIYCTGSLATLVKVLADDTHFVPSGLTFGIPSEIVRLGSKGSDNFYYVPEESDIVKQGEVDISGEKVQFGELGIVGRNNVAAKSVFVGHTAVPVITRETNSKDFNTGVWFMTRQAAQVNDIGRYADQVQLLTVLNLPASLTVSKT